LPIFINRGAPKGIRTADCATFEMSLFGPKRQFAAVQQYGRCRWNTGRSVDVADTAVPDPSRTPSMHRSTCEFVLDFERPATVK
jgi:hypothetical protein